MDYDWPGNVRELKMSLSVEWFSPLRRRSASISSRPSDGPQLLLQPAGRNPDASLFDILEDVERRFIIDKLERCRWNQTDAAEQFRIPLSTLNQKIKRLSIEIKKRMKD